MGTGEPVAIGPAVMKAMSQQFQSDLCDAAATDQPQHRPPLPQLGYYLRWMQTKNRSKSGKLKTMSRAAQWTHMRSKQPVKRKSSICGTASRCEVCTEIGFSPSLLISAPQQIELSGDISLASLRPQTLRAAQHRLLLEHVEIGQMTTAMSPQVLMPNSLHQFGLLLYRLSRNSAHLFFA